MRIQRWLGYAAFAVAYLFVMSVAVLADTVISMSPTMCRAKLYKDINPASPQPRKPSPVGR